LAVSRVRTDARFNQTYGAPSRKRVIEEDDEEELEDEGKPKIKLSFGPRGSID
jgi:hypothetical protein